LTCFNLLQKSDENWRAGKECLAKGLVNAAASRLYYALFQAIYCFGVSINEMEIKHRRGVSRHEQARKLVTRRIGREASQPFRDLEGLRSTADYKPEDVPAGDLAPLLEDVEHMRQKFMEWSR